MSKLSLRQMIAVAAACAIFLLGCEGSQRSATPGENAYTEALAAANTTQVARNIALNSEFPDSSDRASLDAFLVRLISDLGAYAADLERLAPPPTRRSAHQQMIDATRSLGSGYTTLRRATGGGDQSALVDALRPMSELLSAFGQACRALNPPSFVCGSLIEAGVGSTEGS